MHAKKEHRQLDFIYMHIIINFKIAIYVPAKHIVSRMFLVRDI